MDNIHSHSEHCSLKSFLFGLKGVLLGILYSFFYLQALELLNFLLVDSSKKLEDAIADLDPFPDTVKFQRINQSYQQIRKSRTSLSEVRKDHRVLIMIMA